MAVDVSNQTRAARPGQPRRDWLPVGETRIAVDLYGMAPGRPVAVTAHGFSGAPDAPHMRPVIEACLDHGLAVAALHLRNSGWNASEGIVRDFTMAATVDDVAAAVDWLAAEGLGAPALLAGHSMGGYAVLRVAAERPEVAAVLAISPVTSGPWLIAAHEADGSIGRLAEDVPNALREWPTHDLFPLAARIGQPVALIVGERDHLAQPPHVLAFRDRLSNVVYCKVLAGEPHCPVGPEYPPALAEAVEALLKANTGR